MNNIHQNSERIHMGPPGIIHLPMFLSPRNDLASSWFGSPESIDYQLLFFLPLGAEAQKVTIHVKHQFVVLRVAAEFAIHLTAFFMQTITDFKVKGLGFRCHPQHSRFTYRSVTKRMYHRVLTAVWEEIQNTLKMKLLSSILNQTVSSFCSHLMK